MNILPQDIRPEIKEFIINHFTDINEFNFTHLYNELSNEYKELRLLISNFTECILSIGIDPLKYMDRIPDNYLYGNKNLTSIDIPNTIGYIGEKAFHHCNLTSITIPSSVSLIGNYAFAFNSNLTSVIFNEGLKRLNSLAFASCSKLSEVVFPSTFEHLSNGVFSGCTNLKNVYINSDITIGGTVIFLHIPEKVNIYIPKQFTQSIKSFERLRVNEIDLHII